MTIDLVTLALYDIVIWADDSTSMRALDDGERINDLKAILGRVADAATLFDDDGDVLCDLYTDSVPMISFGTLFNPSRGHILERAVALFCRNPSVSSSDYIYKAFLLLVLLVTRSCCRHKREIHEFWSQRRRTEECLRCDKLGV